MANKSNLIGDTLMMNCGMKATCIAYRNANDINIQFEDGTIVEHTRKDHFLSGKIANPNYNSKSCFNRRVKMNNGQVATCIKYRNASDIDIQFEDGTIVEHTRKDHFLEGGIRNPSLINCEGVSLKMNNGQVATCIKYRNSMDIDIRFEDGTIVEHVRKKSFIDKSISNPNYNGNSCLGETYLMSCGLRATCIKYLNNQDIDVQFEDGIIIKHKQKSSFINGKIGHPYYGLKSFPQQIVFYFIKKYFNDAINNYRPVWLKNPMTGFLLEIDVWIPSKKIGIEYDGYTWHKAEAITSKQKFKLIENSKEINKLITVLEDGAIEHVSSKHINFKLTTRSSLLQYSIEKEKFYLELAESIRNILLILGVKDPNVNLSDSKLDVIRESYKNTLVGQEVLMNCGLIATCVFYRNASDIDIQFEDGVVVLHRRRREFLNGMIQHPSYYDSCLNQTVLMTCGMKATCIAYRSNKDIDIKFEDGTIVLNKSKQHFLLGKISNPNIGKYPTKKKSCLGISLQMNNGMNATCIAYRNYVDIDVKFEDGTVVRHVRRNSFIKRTLKNPQLLKTKTKVK